jgi:hypothetical protein
MKTREAHDDRPERTPSSFPSYALHPASDRQDDFAVAGPSERADPNYYWASMALCIRNVNFRLGRETSKSCAMNLATASQPEPRVSAMGRARLQYGPTALAMALRR